MPILKAIGAVGRKGSGLVLNVGTEECMRSLWYVGVRNFIAAELGR